MPGGGGGADLDVVTAGAGNVEAGKVIVGPDGEPLTGTLRNITSDSMIDHASNNTTPVVLGDQAFVSQNSDGVTRAEIRFNGTRGVLEPNTLIAIPQSNMASAGGLTAGKLLAGQSAFGISGTASSGQTASASRIWAGYTATVNGQTVTGNLPTQGGSTTTPGTAAKTIVTPNKIVTGSIIVAGDANLVPGNIKKGVTIFGVQGTHSGYVPSATDLYLRGNNPAGFAVSGTQSRNPYTFQSGAIYVAGSYGYSIKYLLSASSYNLSSYTYVNFEFNNIAGDRAVFRILDAEENTVASAETTGTGSKTLALNISSVNKTTRVGVRINSDETADNTNAVQVYRIWLS